MISETAHNSYSVKVKMATCQDVYFKYRAVIEFLAVGTLYLSDIHRRLERFTGISALSANISLQLGSEEKGKPMISKTACSLVTCQHSHIEIGGDCVCIDILKDYVSGLEEAV